MNVENQAKGGRMGPVADQSTDSITALTLASPLSCAVATTVQIMVRLLPMLSGVLPTLGMFG